MLGIFFAVVGVSPTTHRRERCCWRDANNSPEGERNGILDEDLQGPPSEAPDYPNLDLKKYHLTSERSNVGRKAKNEDLHDLGTDECCLHINKNREAVEHE